MTRKTSSLLLLFGFATFLVALLYLPPVTAGLILIGGLTAGVVLILHRVT